MLILCLVTGILKGNAGREPAFYIELYNRLHGVGGTIVKGAVNPNNSTGLRRYFIIFKSQGDLARTLMYMVRGNLEIFDFL